MSPRSLSVRQADARVLVLAGGEGRRLLPLTQAQTKGAVSFAGMYRLIDFTLSNCLHSGLSRIAVLVQHNYASLERHLRLAWGIFRPELGSCLEIVPPPPQAAETGYRGTADAVYQSLGRLGGAAPRHVLVLASDHVYRMDYRQLLGYHLRRGADLTIACTEVEQEQAHRFGILEVDAARRIVGFVEKPQRPGGLLLRPGVALASMDVYVLDTRVLKDVLRADARRPDSAHDFGRDVIPAMVSGGRRVWAYDVGEEVSRDYYWRDIGTLDAYWEASMELLGAAPPLDPRDPEWPVHSFHPGLPDAQVVVEDRLEARVEAALLCPGVQVTGARVARSILGLDVTVDPRAEVVESVLMEGVHVGPGARIHRAIVDQGVRIPAGARVGSGRQEGLPVSPGGITVVPRGAARLRDAGTAAPCRLAAAGSSP
ncbi:MAG: sugar phosphate nucleotidyltransferase [Gemmatimonadota bacterium]